MKVFSFLEEFGFSEFGLFVKMDLKKDSLHLSGDKRMKKIMNSFEKMMNDFLYEKLESAEDSSVKIRTKFKIGKEDSSKKTMFGYSYIFKDKKIILFSNEDGFCLFFEKTYDELPQKIYEESLKILSRIINKYNKKNHPINEYVELLSHFYIYLEDDTEYVNLPIINEETLDLLDKANITGIGLGGVIEK